MLPAINQNRIVMTEDCRIRVTIQKEILSIVKDGEFVCVPNVPVMTDGGSGDHVWEATSVSRDGDSLTIMVKKHNGVYDRFPVYLFTRISQLQILDSLKSA